MDPENHWLVEENHLSRLPLSGSMLVFGSVIQHTQPFPSRPEEPEAKEVAQKKIEEWQRTAEEDGKTGRCGGVVPLNALYHPRWPSTWVSPSSRPETVLEWKSQLPAKGSQTSHIGSSICFWLGLGQVLMI